MQNKPAGWVVFLQCLCSHPEARTTFARHCHTRMTSICVVRPQDYQSRVRGSYVHVRLRLMIGGRTDCMDRFINNERRRTSPCGGRVAMGHNVDKYLLRLYASNHRAFAKNEVLVWRRGVVEYNNRITIVHFGKGCRLVRKMTRQRVRNWNPRNGGRGERVLLCVHSFMAQRAGGITVTVGHMIDFLIMNTCSIVSAPHSCEINTSSS